MIIGCIRISGGHTFKWETKACDWKIRNFTARDRFNLML